MTLLSPALLFIPQRDFRESGLPNLLFSEKYESSDSSGLTGVDPDIHSHLFVFPTQLLLFSASLLLIDLYALITRREASDLGISLTQQLCTMKRLGSVYTPTSV